MMDSKSLYHGRRFPAPLFSCAVRWHLRFPLSLRETEELLFERGVIVAMRRYGVGAKNLARASRIASGLRVAGGASPRRHRRSQRQTETPLGFSSRGAFSLRNTVAYSAASFSFFSGRTLRRTEAGFAANHLSSPVNGSFPKRFFLAGTSCATTFSKPGSVNSCAPFL